MSTAEFWTIVLVGEALVVIELAIAGPYAMRLARPASGLAGGLAQPGDRAGGVARARRRCRSRS